jgi:hypothetical protein
VLVKSPFKRREGEAMVESFSTIPVKSESVATWQRYVTAPEDGFQESVVASGTLRDPFSGDASDGLAGATGRVVKFQTEEYALVPPGFFAFTRQ